MDFLLLCMVLRSSEIPSKLSLFSAVFCSVLSCAANLIDLNEFTGDSSAEEPLYRQLRLILLDKPYLYDNSLLVLIRRLCLGVTIGLIIDCVNPTGVKVFYMSCSILLYVNSTVVVL